MKLIVKVDLARAQDPVGHVRGLLRAIGAAGRVEEVFPDLRSGSSAGLVSVSLPDARGESSAETIVKALRADAAIAYVETQKTRRARS